MSAKVAPETAIGAESDGAPSSGVTPLGHPFASPAKAEADFVNVVRAEGAHLWDDAGKRYIDGLASLWYCQIGHGRTDMRDAVVAQRHEGVEY